MSTPLGGGTRSASTGRFMSIRYGKLSVKADANDTHPNLTERKTKEGETRHYIEFDYFNGFISGPIQKRETEFGDFLSIPISAADEKYILQLPWLKDAYSYFMNRIENLDLSKPVLFGAFTTDEGYNRMYMKQDEQKVEPVYSKDNPGEKPAWVSQTLNGKTVWDRTDETKYFLQVLEKVNKHFAESTPAQVAEPVATGGGNADDDLPF